MLLREMFRAPRVLADGAVAHAPTGTACVDLDQSKGSRAGCHSIPA